MAQRFLILLICLLPPVLGVAAWGFATWRVEINAAAAQPAVVVAAEVRVAASERVAQAAPVQTSTPAASPTPTSDSDEYADEADPSPFFDSVCAPENEGFWNIKAYPDELSQQYAGANGAHRMKEALAVCKVQVNPIELWQLEEKEYTIRVAGKESANSTPAAGENVWIDVILPQMTDAEAKQEVQSWTFNGDLAPHAYVCETGTGSFKKLALGDILKQTKVRILGGKVHNTAEEVLLGGDRESYYLSLSGGHLADMDVGEALGKVTVKKRKFEVEPRVDGRFFKAPWGSPSLYGNSATVRWVTENNGPTFNLRPDGGTVTGQNSQHTFEITLDSSTAAADLPATLERWGGQYTFQVAGQKPGVTFVQVRPVLDGGGIADPILEIPIVVELPQVAQPGVFQLEAARANASRRVNYTQSESTGDLFQHHTPEQPKMDAAGNVTNYDAMWKWPTGYKWITGQTGDQGFTVQSWSEWTEGTKDLDMLFDVCMHQLGQIVPTGQDAAGKPWHAPLTDSDTLFKDPVSSSGNSALYVLSVEQIRNIWLWHDSSLMSNPDENIRKRLEAETTPQQLWQRARDKVQYSGATPNYVQRTDDASKKERQVLETKVRMLTDQATLARLKRYFSLLKLDARRPAGDWVNAIDPKSDRYGVIQEPMGYVYDPLPTMGHDAMVGQFVWSFTGPLTSLMNTDLTPGWHVGHPFTEDLLRWMITERLMTARAILDDWDRQGIAVGQANWPIVIGFARDVPLEFTVDANSGLGLFRARAQDATFGELPEGFGPGKRYQILDWGDGRDALGAKMESRFDWGRHLYLKVRDLYTGQDVWVPVYGKTPQAGLAIRLVMEAEYLSVCLAGRNLEAFWNTAWNDSPMWVMAFGVGDFLFGASSVHALVTGYDFRTGDKLTPGQYAVNAGVAALNLLPGVASITKRAIVAVRSGAASDLAKSLLSRNLNLAPQTVKEQLRGVVDNLAQGGKDLATSTKTVVINGQALARNLLEAAELKGLNVAAREASEDLAMWFLSHCGHGKMSDSVLVKSGSQAPNVNAFLSLENGAKRAVPDSLLVRQVKTDGVDAAVQAGNNLRQAQAVISSRAGVHGVDGAAAAAEVVASTPTKVVDVVDSGIASLNTRLRLQLSTAEKADVVVETIKATASAKPIATAKLTKPKARKAADIKNRANRDEVKLYNDHVAKLNGQIGEVQGWHKSLRDGHIGLREPGNVNARGIDYITFDADSATLYMWDAKYRRPGGRYPSKIDEATQTRWKVELLDTINSMSEGDLKTQALEAYNANRIRAEIFRWPQ